MGRVILSAIVALIGSSYIMSRLLWSKTYFLLGTFKHYYETFTSDAGLYYLLLIAFGIVYLLVSGVGFVYLSVLFLRLLGLNKR